MQHDTGERIPGKQIIRAADSAGADAVVLSGRSVDAFNPKVVRATTGSIFHLPVVRANDLAVVLDEVKRAGLQVIAADVRGGDLLAARTAGALAAPTAWLFG
ncbi:MAG: RNA methyltransferase, partial [Rhizobium pusense]|nr:RNA methyltransferase [Agrobacterium pusense]